jgi:large subunit ribosomal protein L17
VRHKISGRRLGLPTDQRMALLRNLVTSLLWHGHVTTTATRAKEAKSLAEKLITLAREDNVHHRRTARRFLMPRTGLIESKKGTLREAPAGDRTTSLSGRSAATVENSVTHLFSHVSPQYMDRPGGYSRIVPMGLRKGDGVLEVQLQLVDYKAPEGKEKAKK